MELRVCSGTGSTRAPGADAPPLLRQDPENGIGQILHLFLETIDGMALGVETDTTIPLCHRLVNVVVQRPVVEPGSARQWLFGPVEDRLRRHTRWSAAWLILVPRGSGAPLHAWPKWFHLGPHGFDSCVPGAIFRGEPRNTTVSARSRRATTWLSAQQRLSRSDFVYLVDFNESSRIYVEVLATSRWNPH